MSARSSCSLRRPQSQEDSGQAISGSSQVHVRQVGFEATISGDAQVHEPPVGFEPTTSRLLSGCSTS